MIFTIVQIDPIAGWYANSPNQVLRGGPTLRSLPTVLLLVASPLFAVTGDLDRDGDVDLDDFFILADNFGKRGPAAPETRIETVYSNCV